MLVSRMGNSITFLGIVRHRELRPRTAPRPRRARNDHLASAAPLASQFIPYLRERKIVVKMRAQFQQR